ncbi:hypothetical protein BARVI_01890 [Barnesiella viscericola DSM 18177]|uniref:Uncharacterized protein n=1 Tax=Barnesiella viscericola DSM 18177 TaxID=880074 RepID=W0ERZ1_9BACT|nr:hypothetical protein BARVI_01890 [Barnesiella viscericola DSM 18177]
MMPDCILFYGKTMTNVNKGKQKNSVFSIWIRYNNADQILLFQ